jgi:purine-binding chemotaxis protein CheW
MSETPLNAERSAPTSGPVAGENSEVRQYLTFILAGEEYGVEILRVQEIKGWEGVTRVPHTPHYVLGVMNLRGTVVPVVGLRARFGMEHVEFSSANVVIVVRVTVPRGEKTVGIVVDGVSEVRDFGAADIRPPPEVRSNIDPTLIAGLGTFGEKMVLLLDIDRLVGTSIDSAPSTLTH